MQMYVQWERREKKVIGIVKVILNVDFDQVLAKYYNPDYNKL